MSKSEELANAFAEYRSLKSPKGLNALTLDRIAVGHLDESAVMKELAARIKESIDHRESILKRIGAFSADVNIRLTTPSGRVIDANGPRIVSAIIREDADILKSQVL